MARGMMIAALGGYLLARPAVAQIYEYTTIDDPLATNGQTVAYGISNNGIVTGMYINSGTQYGFVDVGGTFTTLSDTNGYATQGNGVNNAGTVVGSYRVGSGYQGFTYANGVYTTLIDPLSSNTQTYATAINDAGTVAGLYVDNAGVHGFVYQNGTYTTVDVPSATGTEIYGINNNGVLSGTYFDANGSHAFIDDNGTITTVDDPSYPGVANGGGLNDSNTIAGIDNADNGNQQIGFVASGGLITYLADPSAEATYTAAEGINDSGTVVGFYAAASDGGENGFIATEENVPEPASIAMMLAGVAGLMVVRRRSRS